MHLFFESVWKLHIGEIPEKPDFEKLKNNPVFKDYKFYTGYKNEDIQQQHDDEIAAIKQNALTVGNPDILNFEHGEEYNTVIINGDEINKGEFYKWPGGYETKEIYTDRIISPGGIYKSNLRTVAILTLPEEKKNTMENMTIEQKADEYIKRYLPHVDTTGHWLGFQDGYKQALSESSGSVAAPKEHPDFLQWLETEDGKGCMKWPVSEPKYLQNRLFWAFDAGRNCIWDQYVNQKKELESAKEALKDTTEKMIESVSMLDIIRDDIPTGGYDPTDWSIVAINDLIQSSQAIIEKARKLLSK